jgi:hypothetical protein
MTKKGMIVEIFSKALHYDKPAHYLVGYLDFDTVKEVKLLEFLKLSENFEIVPVTRISYIKRGGVVLYSKSNKNESKIV